MKGSAFLLAIVIAGILCLSAVALLQAQPTYPVVSNSDSSVSTANQPEFRADAGTFPAQYDVRSREYQLQRACYDWCWRRYQRILSMDRQSGGTEAARWYQKCTDNCRDGTRY